MVEGLSLVIPAHNSERIIENSLRIYNDVFSRQFTNFEIVVVCNDCWDNTSVICNELSKELPITVIEIPQRGKGFALIKGFRESQFNLIGFLDADNPFDYKRVLRMINYLSVYDIVIASKYIKGRARIQESMMRRLVSLGGGIVSRILFGLNFSDTQAGAKFFRRNVLQIFRKNFVCNGFDFDIEFLYRSKKSNFKIREFHIPIKEDQKFSTFRLKYLPGMLKRLFKLRFLR